MRISVVIPAWNEAEWLPRALKCVRSCPDVAEILVADNSSLDATSEIAIRAGCVLIAGGKPAAGRNAGARASCGEVIVFIDADAVFPPTVLPFVRQAFSGGDIVGLHFRLVPLSASLFVRTCYRFMDRYLSLVGRLGRCQGIGTFIAVRRDAFDATGGFREDVLAGEDADFMRRLSQVVPGHGGIRNDCGLLERHPK